MPYSEDLTITSSSITYDNLFVTGPQPVNVGEETLVTGQSITRGTVLGRITKGAVTSTVTGTGTGTVGSITLGSKAKIGTYTLTCTTAATNAGTFSVKDPDGNTMANATVATAYTSNQINFTIADGTTDFVAGDVIKLVVEAGSGSLKIVNSANVDGSQVPYAIACNDTDATSADKAMPVYYTGNFNSNQLVFGGTDTIDTHQVALKNIGIFTVAAIEA
ncbi:MAG: hypothetical protein H6Q67_1620 [Firmicutes bacterium]|nr:hypothetical protein [Bacillota bacterium]